MSHKSDRDNETHRFDGDDNDNLRPPADQPLQPPTENGDPVQPLILRLLSTIDRLDPDRIDQLWECPGDDDTSIEQAIVCSGLADNQQIASAYANYYLLPLFDPPADESLPIRVAMAKALPESFCRSHMIAPLEDDGITMDVAIVTPDALVLADQVRLQTGRQMKPMFATPELIARLLDHLYGAVRGEATKLIGSQAFDNQLASPIRPASIAMAPLDAADRSEQFIDDILNRIVQAGASELHIEPLRSGFRIRLRVAGRMTELDSQPSEAIRPVVRKLKTLAGITETSPQRYDDGIMRYRCGDRLAQFQLSNYANAFGEKLVIRPLSSDRALRPVSSLGLQTDQLAELTDAISRRGGMVLLTGRQGCGRTTTMFSCLQHLNDGTDNICTIENSIRQKIDGINQLQINRPSRDDVHSALDAVASQRADVLGLGIELCPDTVDACLRLAASGMTVIAKLPAIDAIHGAAVLRSMHGDRGLVADLLCAVTCQHLLPRLCDHCKMETSVQADDANRLGLNESQTVYRCGNRTSCDQCGDPTQVAAFELLPVDHRVAEAFANNATIDALRQSAKSRGFKTMVEVMADQVVSGLIAVDDAVGQLSTVSLSDR